MSNKEHLMNSIHNTPYELDKALETFTSVPTKRQRKETNISAASAVPPTVNGEDTIDNIPDNVLCRYQQLLPENLKAIEFLFGRRFFDTLQEPAKRVASKYGTVEEIAIEELRRLLAIKAYTVDNNANKTSPSPLMDELWHAAILDTQFYAELQAALGLQLHHRPSGANEKEASFRKNRLEVMTAIYRIYFSASPVEHAPIGYNPSPPVIPFQRPLAIFVHIVGIKIFGLVVETQAKIIDVKRAIEDTVGYTPEKQRLVFAGRSMEDNKTLEDYGVRKGNTLHLHMRPTGC